MAMSTGPDSLKDVSRGVSDDMSPQAIARRLEIAAQLWQAVNALGRSQYVGKAFNRLTQVELWVRTITGAVFILAGIYYCLTYIYGVTPLL